MDGGKHEFLAFSPPFPVRSHINSTSIGLFLLLFLALWFLAVSFTSAHADPYTLPDTGQTKCYENVGEIPCPNPGEPFYGQDGNYQGPQLSYQTSTGGLVVSDLNTGLMWQQADDGVERNWDDAVAYCDNLSYGGYSDWRLPSHAELLSIVDYGRYDPAIDPIFAARNLFYWSGTKSAVFPDDAWGVSFGGGNSPGSLAQVANVRCVRGEPMGSGGLHDNSDGTVTDDFTGLTWQKADDAVGRTWQDALSYCENLGPPEIPFTDWRLPNIRELLSIVEDGRYDPAADPLFSAKSDWYWSGTIWNTWLGVSSFVLDFFWDGQLEGMPMGKTAYVRCVRGGPTN